LQHLFQNEQCFYLDNSGGASSLPLYEEIPREESHYQLLEPLTLPEDSSLFLLPAHKQLPRPPSSSTQPRSNRAFFTFHQRREERAGRQTQRAAQSGRSTNRRKQPVYTMDNRKGWRSNINLFCFFKEVYLFLFEMLKHYAANHGYFCCSLAELKEKCMGLFTLHLHGSAKNL
jgi:hypothetical protein